MRLDLPEGYTTRFEGDLLILVAPNRKVIGRFTPATDPAEIERAAVEHSHRVDEGIARLDRLLGRPRRSQRRV